MTNVKVGIMVPLLNLTLSKGIFMEPMSKPLTVFKDNNVQPPKKINVAKPSEINELFSEDFDPWGGPGDMALWGLMRDYFLDHPPSKHLATFEEELKTAFFEITGKTTSELTVTPSTEKKEEDTFYCAKADTSVRPTSGFISKTYWKSTALPFLMKRMELLINKGCVIF
jgi:hypothetical protein